MKHVRMITLLVALSFIFIFSASACASDSPSIVMKETSHDFGPVKKGEVVRHEFGFTNKGRGILKIKEFYLS